MGSQLIQVTYNGVIYKLPVRAGLRICDIKYDIDLFWITMTWWSHHLNPAAFVVHFSTYGRNILSERNSLLQTMRPTLPDKLTSAVQTDLDRIQTAVLTLNTKCSY